MRACTRVYAYTCTSARGRFSLCVRALGRCYVALRVPESRPTGIPDGESGSEKGREETEGEGADIIAKR